MALVDSSYRFTFVDIGDYGSNADGAIFARSAFGQALLDGELDLPGPKELPNYPEGGVLLHCIVADGAFPLRPDIMRPYPRANRQIKLTREELEWLQICCCSKGTQKYLQGLLCQT